MLWLQGSLSAKNDLQPLGKSMPENWIRTDEAEDVAGSIRHALNCLSLVSGDPQAWKWFMMALHSALQGACVCHLTTTAAPVGAVTERNAREWLAYLDDVRTNPNAVLPKTYLMNLPDLLKAVRKPNSAGDRSNAAGVKISEAELRWLRRFHDEFRNQFTHFEPQGWSVEVSGLPNLAKLTARIIAEIMDLGWAFRHLETTERDAMARNLCTLSNISLPT